MKSKNNFQKKSLKDLLYKTQSDFFSNTFSFIINIINYFLFLYIMFSFIFYIFFHFFALNVEVFGYNETTFISTDSMLLKNNFNNIILACIIILGMLSVKKQNYFYFIIYLSTYALFIFSFIFKMNFTLIPIYSYFYTIFNSLLFFGFFILSLYSILYYFQIYGFVKNNINDIPIDKIIHEIKLKSDLAKMSYNAFMIKHGLHKISKKLLYTKKDYYFMNMENDNDNEKIKKEFINEYDNESKLNSESGTYASTIDNNYINLDNESQPLKN